MAYGATFRIVTPQADGIVPVSLIRLGAVTHAFDENQRFQWLTFSKDGTGLDVTAPSSSNRAPPGHYMVFILTATTCRRSAHHPDPLERRRCRSVRRPSRPASFRRARRVALACSDERSTSRSRGGRPWVIHPDPEVGADAPLDLSYSAAIASW